MSEYDDLLPETVILSEAVTDAEEFDPPLLRVPKEPAEEPKPGLIVKRNAYGPGVHSVTFQDETPVGVYIRAHEMSPQAVEEMLVNLDADEDIVDFFVRNRTKGIEADARIERHYSEPPDPTPDDWVMPKREIFVPLDDHFRPDPKGKK